MIKPDDVLLFQGDSITDAMRDKALTGANNRNAIGCGYVSFVASKLLETYAGKPLQIYNRGVSGDKLARMAGRWQEDALDLKPTVISILIGINDIFDNLPGHTPDAPHLREYDERYRALLKQTAQALPGVRFIIGETFSGPCGEVTPEWEPIVAARRQTARRVADEFGAVFIPYQSIFNQAGARTTIQDWLPDGVHPSMAGQLLMARAWLSAVQGSSF